MNHAELTSALAKISDEIHVKKLDIESQKKRLSFSLTTAVEQELNPDRSRADSAKISLAEAYMQMNALQYQLEALTEKRKNIQKALTRISA